MCIPAAMQLLDWLLHSRSGGYLSRCGDTGTCHYLGVLFCGKGRNYRYHSFEYVRNYGCFLKKHAELWALFREIVAKVAKKSKGYGKVVS